MIGILTRAAFAGLAAAQGGFLASLDASRTAAAGGAWAGMASGAVDALAAAGVMSATRPAVPGEGGKWVPETEAALRRTPGEYVAGATPENGGGRA